MSKGRTDSTRRYECARLICTYMLSHHLTTAAVTARDIAQFFNLSRRSSRSISAMLNFVYTNRIHKSRFGFSIRGTSPLSSWDYPHRFTIELIDNARGLL